MHCTGARWMKASAATGCWNTEKTGSVAAAMPRASLPVSSAAPTPSWVWRPSIRCWTMTCFNEDLHRRIMRGKARLGRLYAARRTFNLLEKRFESIDMEVGLSTRADQGVDPWKHRVAARGRTVRSRSAIGGYQLSRRLCKLGALPLLCC